MKLQNEEDMNSDYYKFCDHSDQLFGKKIKVFKLSDIEEVFKRRYYLIHQGFECFTKFKKSYFFNLINEANCEKFFEQLVKIRSAKRYKFHLVQNSAKEFEKKEYRQNWMAGQISN